MTSFSKAKYRSTVYIDHGFLIPGTLSVDGHLRYFCILPTVSSAAAVAEVPTVSNVARVTEVQAVRGGDFISFGSIAHLQKGICFFSLWHMILTSRPI